MLCRIAAYQCQCLRLFFYVCCLWVSELLNPELTGLNLEVSDTVQICLCFSVPPALLYI